MSQAKKRLEAFMFNGPPSLILVDNLESQIL